MPSPFSAKRILITGGAAPIPAATWTRGEREFVVTIRNDASGGGPVYVTSLPDGGVDDAHPIPSGDLIEIRVPAASPFTPPTTETAYVFADTNRYAYVFVAPH
ncbi:hypothetical protein [Nocardia puris]|uniref:hypothetical protein n=1 Tax=Nocardia puris TaxID=208602 RepID=UPI002E1EC794